MTRPPAKPRPRPGIPASEQVWWFVVLLVLHAGTVFVLIVKAMYVLATLTLGRS